MSELGPSSSGTDALRDQVAALRLALSRFEEQRETAARRRRLHLLIVGVGISLLVHLGLMYYLALSFRSVPAGTGPEPVTYEFAILQEEELTDLESAELDDLIPQIVSEFEDLAMKEPATELDPVIPAAELEIDRAGAMPTLGGAGDEAGAGGSLVGGGAGTSFFGVSSRGMRFAYVVDRSGSMGEHRKMQVAMNELARSVSSLPDYASFYVLLFSNHYRQPPGQDGWTQAKRSNVNSFIRWLNTVDPGGGTNPMPAFSQVFSLDEGADVIFFLTDGQIPGDHDEIVATLKRQSGRVVINTIAFGDPRSQDLLKRIARQSGGVYRFVPVEGR
ncbi:MAG: VWA domain-containing protein [Planctomycetota bacterium]|nr:VWA domain-containing protein [Planctomycetota bacterium]